MRQSTQLGRALTCLIGIVLAMTATTPLIGATKVAISSGAWGSHSTWSDGNIPTSVDSVVIGDSLTVTLDIANATCATLQLSGNDSATLILFDDSARLDVSGDITLGATSSTGRILISAGNLGIGGSLLLTNGILEVTGGAVEYNGTGAQTVATATYHDLYLYGGLKTAGGPLTVNGRVVIYQTAILDAKSFTHSVKGEWWNLGGFIPGTSTIVFAGDSVQSLFGHSSFNNLTVNNGAGIRLENGIADSVNGMLIFASGNLILGETSLQMGLFSSISGAGSGRCVITGGGGYLKRRILGAGNTFMFPVAHTPGSFNPVTISLQNSPFEAAELFSVRVSVFDSSSPGFSKTDTSRCVWRVWEVTEASKGNNNANLTFQWNDNEDGSAVGVGKGSSVSAASYRYDDSTGSYLFVDDISGPPPVNNLIVGATPNFLVTEFGQFIVGHSQLSTSVEENNIPAVFALGQNYPNPFNPTTTVEFSMPTAEHVSLRVYDVLGREVATLVNGFRSPGKYTEQFNATALASGTYLYRITTPSFTSTRKLLLVR